MEQQAAMVIGLLVQMENHCTEKMYCR